MGASLKCGSSPAGHEALPLRLTKPSATCPIRERPGSRSRRPLVASTWVCPHVGLRVVRCASRFRGFAVLVRPRDQHNRTPLGKSSPNMASASLWLKGSVQNQHGQANTAPRWRHTGSMHGTCEAHRGARPVISETMWCADAVDATCGRVM